MQVQTLLILITVGACPALQAQEVLPPMLEQHAESIGCRGVADYYDAPAREEPPYVFGYLDSGADPTGENSAVYWCKPGADGEKSRLVIWFAAELGRRPPCQPLSWINPASGLSLDRTPQLLSSFFLIDPARLRAIRSGAKPGPVPPSPPGSTSSPIIISTYDGFTEEFNCHEGQWLIRQFD